MRDVMDDQFEVVGDPEALPDAFFDALAALLIATSESDAPNPACEQVCQGDS